MTTPSNIKQKFDELYAQWLEAIQKPPIAFSSKPQDYTNVEAYKRIVALGPDVLPLVLEKLEQGEFLMNEAALKLGNISLDDLGVSETSRAGQRAEATQEPPRFLSEQQKARLILEHLHG